MHYATITCQKIDGRHCRMIASEKKSELGLIFKIPFFKTERNIWIFVHNIKNVFHKRGVEITCSQISSALSSEYPNIPYVYY